MLQLGSVKPNPFTVQMKELTCLPINMSTKGRLPRSGVLFMPSPVPCVDASLACDWPEPPLGGA